MDNTPLQNVMPLLPNHEIIFIKENDIDYQKPLALYRNNIYNITNVNKYGQENDDCILLMYTTM